MLNRYYFYENKNTHDPHRTLALEEAMLDTLLPGEIILYLYTHKKTVVIGKNQNAWKECPAEKLESDGGFLARRISGGGAVYHDEGNLNFSFIMHKDDYDLTRQLSVIVKAANEFGVCAEFSGRNDILAGGRKFSGNAFCHKKENSFHHGTILINTDMSEMTKYLTVSEDKIKSKGIESVRSRVCNLSGMSAGITVDKMAAALRQAFDGIYGKSEDYAISAKTEQKAKEYAKRNDTWEWKFGYMGNFDITMQNRFPWGGVEICLDLKDAVIKSSRIFSDAMDADYIMSLQGRLEGSPFRTDAMVKAIAGAAKTPAQKHMEADITEFLRSRTV